PGCNARGVVEYVLSCLLTFAEQSATPWQDRTVGIIGVGEVGGRLAAVLQALGVKTLLCDPPLAEQGREGLIELDELIAHSDVISCHVPLTREGPHPTWHLLDGRRLERLRPGTWLINRSSGAVIDDQGLNAVLGQRRGVREARDVCETEPRVDPALADRCRRATPLIAC